MSIRTTITIMIALLLVTSNRAYAQSDYDKVWVQGETGVFSTTFINGMAQCGLIDTSTTLYFGYGNSNICDSLGNLILVSDGFNVYNKNINLIQNGDSLVPKARIIKEDGWSSYIQSSIFLPMGNNKYYFITPTASDYEVNTYWNNPGLGRGLFDEMYYNIVDMKANNGAGSVTKRMVRILQNVQLSKTQMMACRHADGKAWWVLKQASETNLIYKFLFTKDSVYGPFTQSFAQPVFSKFDQSGQSVFSQDGTKYATTCRATGKIFIADFDRCNGNLSNPEVYEVPTFKNHNPLDTNQLDVPTNGLAFSPNGRFLYVNGFYNISQIDRFDTNPATAFVKIAALDTLWRDFNSYSGLHLGPDGKLYVGNWNGLSGQMSVINNPDNKGGACNFCPRCLRFPLIGISGGRYNVGVINPPCMPNYHLGKSANFCFPAGVEALPEELAFAVYPTPATAYLQFEYPKPGIVLLTDMTGRQVKRVSLMAANTKQLVSIADLAAGVYLYAYVVGDVVMARGKVVVR